jgi:flagellar protein FliO/FliZ
MTAPRAARLTAAISLFLPGAAIAAEPASLGSGWGSLLQGLFGLLVVFALLYGFFILLRRYGPATQGAQGAIKIVGGVMLGPRERLVMVEVENTWLVLGVTAGQVNLVHSLAKPADAETRAAPPPPPFAGKLAAMLRQPGQG